MTFDELLTYVVANIGEEKQALVLFMTKDSRLQSAGTASLDPATASMMAIGLIGHLNQILAMHPPKEKTE